jgi:hypothetical protein
MPRGFRVRRSMSKPTARRAFSGRPTRSRRAGRVSWTDQGITPSGVVGGVRGPRGWIRDQLPMRLGPLEDCLRGVTVADWLQLLNSHVFFWAREERLLTLLNARAYRARKHTVLVLRSDVLLARHASGVRLTPMNTGSTIYVPRPRGIETFCRVEDFDLRARRKRAGRDAVVELAVRDRVSIDDGIVESVGRFEGGTQIETLFP